MTTVIRRCLWCGSEPLYVKYHDTEWGVPVHDDQKLFEFLLLEGAQAGLNWLTILKRRQGYQQAFANFNAQQVANFTQEQLAILMQDPGIIRNRLKIAAAVTNAQAFLAIQEQFGSFAQYSWQFVNGASIINAWQDSTAVPTTSTVSDAFSKDLKQRGFKFVGSTIIYAYMQAIGMVNDHLVDCFRYHELCGAMI